MNTAARFLRRTWLAALLAVAAVSLIASQAPAQDIPLEDLAKFPRTNVKIRSGGKTHTFSVWVADTPRRQAQGLMFVRELPEDQGMIFIHNPPRTTSMWMKNTYIELDMLFIAEDGRIVKIAERAQPHSLTTIPSGLPVAAVLELKGGEAARRKLAVGDRASWEPLRTP